MGSPAFDPFNGAVISVVRQALGGLTGGKGSVLWSGEELTRAGPEAGCRVQIIERGRVIAFARARVGLGRGGWRCEINVLEAHRV